MTQAVSEKLPLDVELSQRLVGRVLLVGIGNRWRGDDGAGPTLIDRLQGQVEISLLDCGEVPESYLGKMVEAQPDTVVLVDALDFGEEPGSVGIFDSAYLPERPGSTHDVPLRCLAEYLCEETGAKVVALGIQPRTTALGDSLSPEVAQTIDQLSELLIHQFRSHCPR